MTRLAALAAGGCTHLPSSSSGAQAVAHEDLKNETSTASASAGASTTCAAEDAVAAAPSIEELIRIARLEN